jgi:hypothetical protein
LSEERVEQFGGAYGADLRVEDAVLTAAEATEELGTVVDG